jgi:hypothetical protein
MAETVEWQSIAGLLPERAGDQSLPLSVNWHVAAASK